MVMTPQQYCQHSNCEGPAVQLNPGNIIFASYRSTSGVSRFLVGPAVVSAIMAVEFAVFLPHTKCFNVLAIYCSRAYSICNRSSQNGGGRTRYQAILLTTVVISHTFCTENEKELTP